MIISQTDRPAAIAVVIPVYNAGKDLHACIRSVLKQSFKDFVLILVDDGSTDESGSICDQYAAAHSRILVIHQENRGSVEARKTGIFSRSAQSAAYIFLSDADDTIPPDALQKLYKMAEAYDAECVCGNMVRLYKGIRIRSRHQAPCFSIEKEEVYDHARIMDELYISCFGVTNYPVNLFAKLYRTELISRAADFPPVVQFMGDDLSVTVRCLPEIQRLVIIPDVVYAYRLGGGTSRFMPSMWDDFLALYRYKSALAEQYQVLEQMRRTMNIELMNIVRSWLLSCREARQYTKEQLLEEIGSVLAVSEVYEAAVWLQENNISHVLVEPVIRHDVQAIAELIEQCYTAGRRRRLIRTIMSKL